MISERVVEAQVQFFSRCALGKSINLDGTGYTIVGVTPASFDFSGLFRDVDVYVPVRPMEESACFQSAARAWEFMASAG